MNTLQKIGTYTTIAITALGAIGCSQNEQINPEYEAASKQQVDVAGLYGELTQAQAGLMRGSSPGMVAHNVGLYEVIRNIDFVESHIRDAEPLQGFESLVDSLQTEREKLEAKYNSLSTVLDSIPKYLDKN